MRRRAEPRDSGRAHAQGWCRWSVAAAAGAGSDAQPADVARGVAHGLDGVQRRVLEVRRRAPPAAADYEIARRAIAATRCAMRGFGWFRLVSVGLYSVAGRADRERLGNSPCCLCAGLSVSTRSGQYVAQCIGDAVAVSKWEWYWKAEGGEASEAVQRGWKGKDPSPPIPKFGDRPPIVAQLWLSEDAKAVAVLAIDPDDFSNREVYLLARASATGSWPPYWKAKPEIESPNRAKGLNLSAQELFLGRVLAQFFDTPQTGWCCHVAHVWRRVEEGDQYRGFPPQLIVQVRALCIKMDTSVFKSEKAQLQLQTRESWMALEQALNVGLEDVLSSPVVARMDPTGSVLAIVVNHAAGTPLLFVGMPGFEVRLRICIFTWYADVTLRA
eukprot:SAG31_NODE_38_length_31498_cov_41.930539_17_plen_385_part_00